MPADLGRPPRPCPGCRSKRRRYVDLDNQNWTHRVRIAGYGLGRTPPATIVRDAADSHVFGIEVDNDITGRYESFLDRDAKLAAAIRALASEAHTAGNRAFVYIAGTECITKDADSTRHTLARDYPDWLQRKLSGEPAVFTGGAAFWIIERRRGRLDLPVRHGLARAVYDAGAPDRWRRVSMASMWMSCTG